MSWNPRIKEGYALLKYVMDEFGDDLAYARLEHKKFKYDGDKELFAPEVNIWMKT